MKAADHELHPRVDRGLQWSCRQSEWAAWWMDRWNYWDLLNTLRLFSNTFTTAVVLASEFCQAFIYMTLSVGVGAMGKYSNKLCFGTLKCWNVEVLILHKSSGGKVNSILTLSLASWKECSPMLGRLCSSICGVVMNIILALETISFQPILR